MKAAFIERPGPPEEIRYGDLSTPVPGPNQILVKVRAVTVDPVDTYIRAARYVVPMPLPFIIGRDMAGEVEAVGRGVTRFSPGQHVWCNNQGYAGRQGTFAEFVAVDEDLLYHLPDGIDYQAAVAAVHSGLTACTGLRIAGAKEGETLFVNGGSGNVGSAVLQFARAKGLRAIATAGSADKLAQCMEAGAERAINYKSDDVSAAARDFAPEGIDIYWDIAPQPDFERAIPLLKQRGRMIIMTGFTAHPSFPTGTFYTKDCSLYGFAITNAAADELRHCADEINRLLEAGVLKAKIDRVLPLADAAQAHRTIEQHGSELNGKIVLVP